MVEINDQGKRRMESASDNSARSYYFKVLITITSVGMQVALDLLAEDGVELSVVLCSLTSFCLRTS